MDDYLMVLKIRAECAADADELINDYSGKETHIEILVTEKVVEQ